MAAMNLLFHLIVNSVCTYWHTDDSSAALWIIFCKQHGYLLCIWKYLDLLSQKDNILSSSLSLSPRFPPWWMCVSLQWSHAVRSCMTLSLRTRESWPWKWATLSPWFLRSMTTGTREPFVDKRDTSLWRLSKSWCLYHTKSSQSSSFFSFMWRERSLFVSYLSFFFFLFWLHQCLGFWVFCLCERCRKSLIRQWM